MINTKVIITGSCLVDKLSIAKELIKKDDDLSIAMTFTSDKEYKDKPNDNYIYFMDSSEIDLAYKNNVLFYVSTENYVSNGITMDSLYNDDIFCLSIKDFNNISNNIFNSKLYEIIVIWVDSKFTEKTPEVLEDIRETKYLIERLNSVKYMYFLDEKPEDISDVIIEYINGDELIQAKLLEENN